MATNFYTGINLNGNEVTGLPNTPTTSTAAVSKAYVDSVVQGLDVKDSVKAATTGNITLSGLGAVGGYTPSANDRILVKNQTTASENGIYLAKSDAWVLAADTVTLGSFTFVEYGDNAGSGWVYSSTNTWTKFSEAGALSAGNGISISSGTVSVVAGTNITVNSSGVSVSGTIGVANGGTGATTLTGYVKGSGTSALTASATIPVRDIADRRIKGTQAVAADSSYVISTTSLESTLRDTAQVTLFNNATGERVFADVVVGADSVTISVGKVPALLTLGYVITV